jgi:hypothetical protein
MAAGLPKEERYLLLLGSAVFYFEARIIVWRQKGGFSMKWG